MPLVCLLVIALLWSATTAATEIAADFGSWKVHQGTGKDKREIVQARTLVETDYLTDEPVFLALACGTKELTMQFLIVEFELLMPTYTMEWRVGSHPVITSKSTSFTIIDAFDVEPAIAQALAGEADGQLLKIRLSNPVTDSAYARRGAGDDWPRVYTARLDGFAAAHSQLADHCAQNARNQSHSAG